MIWTKEQITFSQRNLPSMKVILMIIVQRLLSTLLKTCCPLGKPRRSCNLPSSLLCLLSSWFKTLISTAARCFQSAQKRTRTTLALTNRYVLSLFSALSAKTTFKRCFKWNKQTLTLAIQKSLTWPWEFPLRKEACLSTTSQRGQRADTSSMRQSELAVWLPTVCLISVAYPSMWVK